MRSVERHIFSVPPERKVLCGIARAELNAARCLVAADARSSFQRIPQIFSRYLHKRGQNSGTRNPLNLSDFFGVKARLSGDLRFGQIMWILSGFISRGASFLRAFPAVDYSNRGGDLCETGCRCVGLK